jgi:transcriptional regulator with XRE-family HTH domain
MMPPVVGLTSLGPRLRLLRLARGLTQEELAARSGVHATLVTRIERGRRPVTPRELARLQAALGVAPPPADGGTDAPTP